MTDEGVIPLLELLRSFFPEWMKYYGLSIVVLGWCLKPIFRGIVWLAAKGADLTANKWDNEAVQVLSTVLDYVAMFFDVARRVMPGMGFGPFPAKQAITTKMSRRPPPIQIPPPLGARLNSIPPIAADHGPLRTPSLPPANEPVPIAAASLPPAYYERSTDPALKSPLPTRPRQDTPAETLVAKSKRLREAAQRRG
jgi:hypothetical protein